MWFSIKRREDIVKTEFKKLYILDSQLLEAELFFEHNFSYFSAGSLKNKEVKYTIILHIKADVF